MLHDSFLYNYNYKGIRHVEDIFNKLGIPILSFFKDYYPQKHIAMPGLRSPGIMSYKQLIDTTHAHTHTLKCKAHQYYSIYLIHILVLFLFFRQRLNK